MNERYAEAVELVNKFNLCLVFKLPITLCEKWQTREIQRKSSYIFIVGAAIAKSLRLLDEFAKFKLSGVDSGVFYFFSQHRAHQSKMKKKLTY